MAAPDVAPTRFESPAAPLQHTRAVLLARDCLALGARISVAQRLSGLSDIEMTRLSKEMAVGVRTGRVPRGCTWYLVKAHLFERVEASLLTAIFSLVRPHARHPAEALVAAYRQYLLLCPLRRIGFDLAFDLTSSANGLWQSKTYLVTLATCVRCEGRYLTHYGDGRPGSPGCPYCAVARRADRDPRVGQSFTAARPNDDLARWQDWFSAWAASPEPSASSTP